MIPVSHDGFVIGDGILFYLAKDELLFVGRAPTVNWLQFHAETGGYRRFGDSRRPFAIATQRPGGDATSFPLSGAGTARGAGAGEVEWGPLPDIRFFNFDWINVAGHRVRALRHGMAGEPGLEVFGPYEQRDEIRAAILEAGKDVGIVAVGSRTYASNTLESGWIPSPLPAVYTGENMRALPRVASGERLRGHRFAGRQLRLVEHRGLLPHALRTRIRAVREIRSRIHRPRGARAAGARRAAASAQGDLRMEWRRPGQDSRFAARSREPALQVLRLADRKLRFVVLRQGDAR